MARNLVDLNLVEISLVDAGANPGAHIALFKARGDKMDIEQIKKSLETAEATIADLTKQVADLTAEKEKVTKAGKDQAEEITKRDEKIAKLEGDIETAALAAEVEKKFPLTVGTVAEKIAKLKAVRAIPDETTRKAVEKSLEDAEARLADLAKSKGNDTDVNKNASDESEISKIQKKIMSDDKTLTPEQAFRKALETPEGRKAYNEMRAEQASNKGEE